ncbi:hypothetical protein [Peptostreptococcus sp. MV1]|uniref:hypothetical protein n=1 Tax=Peptostreptococcus sp. MV1 TaxID=1219626 RepID=UPI00068B80DB|nr:hypothetical protein [Peptostreptococcus sp. MV1]
MNILLFVIIGISNLIMCLVFWFTLKKILDYKNGMVLGMHVDKDKMEDPDILRLIEKYGKKLGILKLILLVGSILTLAVIWLNVDIFIVVYMVWLILVIGYYQYISVFCMRDMYSLKEDRGWINKESNLIKIDTRVSSMDDKMKLSPLVHLPFLFVYGYLIIDGIIEGPVLKSIFRGVDQSAYMDLKFMLIIIFAISVFISLSYLLVHIIYGDRKNQVYCEDSPINYMANRVDKLYWSRASLLADLLVFITSMYILYRLIGNAWLYDVDMAIYVVGLFLSSMTCIFVAKIANTKRDDILSYAKNIEYMDDDYYWRKGWYSNPNDKRIFVPSRLNSMNQEFNMAKKSAKIINLLLAILILGTFFICFLQPNKDVEITSKGDRIKVSSGFYKTEFKRSDVLGLDLVDDMEDDSYIRTNGISMGEIKIGRFRGKRIGGLDLYVNSPNRPLVRIKLKHRLVYISGDKDLKAEDVYKLVKGK